MPPNCLASFWRFAGRDRKFDHLFLNPDNNFEKSAKVPRGEPLVASRAAAGGIVGVSK